MILLAGIALIVLVTVIGVSLCEAAGMEVSFPDEETRP